MFTIAICDDNKRDSTKIESIVKSYMDTKFIPYQVNIFKSGEELLESVLKPDLLFLDIAMEGINGIQAGKKMREIHRNVKIIYTTSFQQYCKQAVNNVHAFAYLEKPIKEDKAQQQLEDIMRCIQEEKDKIEIVKFEVLEITQDGKVDNKIQSFDVKDIYYFEYFNRKIRLKLENEEYFFIDKMKELVMKMQKFDFAICHQCFLVNLRHIKKIKGYEVFLANNETLPVSQKKSAEFRKQLNKFIQSSI